MATANGHPSEETALSTPRESAAHAHRDARAPRTIGKTPAPDDEVLAEMRRVAALPGGTPLTGSFYDSRRSPGAIGAARIIQRFDSWAKACHAAGVAVEERTRAYRKGWTEEELLHWARRFLNETETSPSFMNFQFWLRRYKHDGAPSAATMRNRLGTWSTIVERAKEK